MASGDLLMVFLPDQNDIPPNTNPATPGTLATDTGNRPTLLFDDTTDETAIWSFTLAARYGGGGLTAALGYAMDTASTNTVGWEIGIERVNPGAALGTGGSDFAASNFTDQTVPGSAKQLSVATITFTNGADMDSLAASEFARFKVNRDADSSNATDTAAGDAHLLFVNLFET